MDILDWLIDGGYGRLGEHTDYGDPVKDFLASDSNPWVDRENSDHNDANNYYLTLLGMIPGLDSALKGMGAWKDLSDYMKNYGLTWGDVIPWHATKAFSLGAGFGTLNFMSSNIEKFYKNH